MPNSGPDTTPPPEEGGDKRVVRPPSRVRWPSFKVRPLLMTYVLWRMLVRLCIVLTVMLVIGVLYTARWIQERPDDFIQAGLRLSGLEITVNESFWTEDGKLRLNRVRFGPEENLWMIVGRIDLGFTWLDLLLEGKVEELELSYPQLWMSRYIKAMEESGELPPISFGRTRIVAGTIMLDEIAPDVDPIPIQLGQKKPLEVAGFRLNNWKESPMLDRTQTATVKDLLITSPYDALSPVLSFGEIAITFTWEGLLDNEIDRLVAVEPIIYLGPDLFWFTNEFQKGAGTKAVSKSWMIKEFVAKEGRLGINVFGAGGIVLPPPFFCEARNMDLGDLNRTKVNTLFKFKRQDYKYPEYGLELDGVRGRIEFALPLDAERADNVVPTLFADAIAWQGIAITEAWTSVTFDEKGIYGKLGGKFYEGDVSSNFQILFNGDFGWQGDFFVLKTNMQPIIQDLISRYLELKGFANGKFHIEGAATKIKTVTADFELLEKGVFNVKFIADLEDRIPKDWLPLYQQLATILIDSFKTYDFTGGYVKAKYVPNLSTGEMVLNGLQGKRTINVRVKNEEPAKAKIAKTEKDE
ncbi:MAG: hypothetical protein AAGK14_02990 [Verrucomicrobiota bacterium]